MVLAGYNCSYRCITRAARRAGKAIEDNPSYWEIYPFLPRETRGFVPKFIASALIVSNPEMYGIQAENFGQELAFDIVKINGMLSVEAAAMLAGTDVATIRALNTELLKASLPDQAEPYSLRIPLDTFERFVRSFDNLPAQTKVSPSEYLIVSGDTLGRIARNFDTTVDELKATNGIRTNLIHPGQKLLIPGTGISSTIAIASTEKQSIAYGESQFKPIKLREEFQLVELNGSTEAAPLMAVSLSPDVEDDLLVPTIYQVRRGDTLGVISERFDVSVRELPVLLLAIDPLKKSLLLLSLRDLEEELHDNGAILREMPFIVVNRSITILPKLLHVLRASGRQLLILGDNLRMHFAHEHFLVIGSIKDPHGATRWQC